MNILQTLGHKLIPDSTNSELYLITLILPKILESPLARNDLMPRKITKTLAHLALIITRHTTKSILTFHTESSESKFNNEIIINNKKTYSVDRVSIFKITKNI